MTCGDGARNGVEACDGTAFGGLSCASLGLGVGTLTCAGTCLSVETSGCHAPTADAGVTSPSDASLDSCAGVDCSGHGVCAVAAGQPLCVCDPGYEPSGLACAQHVNGAPALESLEPNPAELTQGQSVRLTAVVSDPDGIGDIGGGRVEDSVGTRLALFTPVGPGQYEAAVTWVDLQESSNIEFVGESVRVLVVVFFDTSGNETRTQTQLRLHCGSAGVTGACAGECMALDTSERCGSCSQGCGFSDPVREWSGMCAGSECSFEAALPDGTGATECYTGCSNLFPNAVCAGASGSTYLLGFIGAIPNVSCGQPLEAVYPTQVRLSDLTCECRSTSGVYRTLAKPRSTTCTSLCASTYGDPCFLLHFTGTIPSGESVFGADSCEPPYLRASWDGVGIGDVVAYQDNLSNLRCDCRVPAR